LEGAHVTVDRRRVVDVFHPSHAAIGGARFLGLRFVYCSMLGPGSVVVVVLGPARSRFVSARFVGHDLDVVLSLVVVSVRTLEASVARNFAVYSVTSPSASTAHAGLGFDGAVGR